jgi:hypothetical protein
MSHDLSSAVLPVETNTAMVQLSFEEIARRWLSDNNLMGIDHRVVSELLDCYRRHGPREIVFDQGKMTYFLRDKAATKGN